MSVVNTTALSRNIRSLALRQCRCASAGSRTIQTSAVWRDAVDSGSREVDIRGKLKDALKAAMKGKDKEAVGTIRVSSSFLESGRFSGQAQASLTVALFTFTNSR